MAAIPTIGQNVNSINRISVSKGIFNSFGVRVADFNALVDRVNSVISDAGSIVVSVEDLADGTAAAPSLAFADDTDTGIFRSAANKIGFTAGGTEVAKIDSNGLVADIVSELTSAAGVTIDSVLLKDSLILTGNGLVSTPSIQIGEPDTGLYKVGETQTGFSQDGVLVGGFDSSGLFTGNIAEQVVGVGVTIDGVHCKDGIISDEIDTFGDGKAIPTYSCRTLKYSVGVPTATGVDYNFASAANANEQSIQLGGGAVIPALAKVVNVVIKCTESLSTGAATSTSDVGTSSGGAQFITAGAVDDANDIADSDFTSIAVSTSASSVYFSVDPDTNWDDATMTTGKWEIYITYIDNASAR